MLAGQVYSGEARVEKAGQLLACAAPLTVRDGGLRYVSRGGLKLEAALDHFGLDVAGLEALDLGASTGGFTDCLLQRGAASVVAVDVGFGQLHPRLRGDPRVLVRERLNARGLTREHVERDVDLLVGDVSFISLRLVLPPALRFLKPGGALLVLVKPQFEVGRADVGKGGVVRDASKRREAIEGIAAFAAGLGLLVQGWMDSPVAGPAGNVEALLFARKPPAP